MLVTVLQVGISLLQATPAAVGPVLIHDLGISRAELGLLSSAIWGGMLLGSLPSGLLVDRYGERFVVSAGVVAMALLIVWASFSNSFALIFGLFLLSAVGAATASPGGTRAIAQSVPRHRLGVGLGVRQTGVMAGGLLASLLLPVIAVSAGWGAAFRVGAAFCLVTVALFGLIYREPSRTSAARRPFRLRSLLRNRVFLATSAYGFVLMGALGATIAYLPLWLHEQVGLSVVVAAQLLAVMQFGGLVGRLAWGWLSDRIGRRGPVMLACGVLAILSCAAAIPAGRATPGPLLIALAFLLGLSTLGWNALSIAVISESVPLESAGTALGANLSITFTAMFVVSPLFGLIADWTGSYRVSWIALTAWVCLGTALGLLIREGRRAASGPAAG
jgi:MFS family permease